MQELFEKYIDGKCSLEEYEKMVAFICDPEKDIYLTGLLRSLWKKNPKSEPSIQPDTNLLHFIHHQISLQESQQFRKIRIYQWISAIAAVLIIGLISSVLLFMQPRKTEFTMQHVTVPFGGKTHFTLPDGSKVWVNSGSTFSYPDRFSKERIVELQGEAYFEVAQQTNPFFVRSRYGEVKVLGTEFNVKAYDDELFETTLVNGSVVVDGKNGHQVNLTPGTQVIFDAEKYIKRPVETELFTSWKDGQLIFRDTPLRVMIPRLERWYNVDIETQFRDESIKDLKFTATIEFESFSEVLELIHVTTPIEYLYDKDTRVLIIKSP
jgi:transmembrane sensor